MDDGPRARSDTRIPRSPGPSISLLGLFVPEPMHRRILPVVLLSVSLAGALLARQTSPLEVNRLRFEGNGALNDDQLLNVIRTRQSPMGFWKFIYAHISEKIGEAPEYYDPIAFEGDFRSLRAFYQDQGFYHARIDTQVVLRPMDREADLTFRIVEGRRSLVDTVTWRGLDGLPSDVLSEIQGNRLIEKGEPFIKSRADAELRRIVGVFANKGYLGARADTVVAVRYASTNNFSVRFSFTSGQRYLFGTVQIQQDTTAERSIDESVIRRHLDFAEGDFYSEQRKFESERNLSRLGVFEAAKIENAVTNPTPGQVQIPVNVMVRARPFQELTPEIGINDENNAFNILTGLGYSHRNFFGGARSFTTRLRLSLQSIQYARLDRIFSQTGLRDSSIVSKVEFTTQLIQPYFFNNKTSLSFTLTASLDKQPSYYLPVLRSRVGVMAQTATYTRAFLDWTLELSDPKTVSTQRDTVLGDEFPKQFNSFITFTLQRDRRNDLFSPSEGFFHSMSVEESGIFPRLIGPLLGTKLPYSQYIKASALGQWYVDPSGKRDWIWAFRLYGGAAFLYGSDTVDVPLTQRFFGGGSGSVRGWRARYLGAVSDPKYGGRATVEGSVEGRWNLLKGAGSFWFIDLEKFSLVFFADAGNVWPAVGQLRVSEIAVASGFGLRYNTVAGPIRIDFGMRMYDPSQPNGRRWVGQRRFFPEVFSDGVIHLGVGHAF